MQQNKTHKKINSQNNSIEQPTIHTHKRIPNKAAQENHKKNPKNTHRWTREAWNSGSNEGNPRIGGGSRGAFVAEIIKRERAREGFTMEPKEESPRGARQ